MEASQTKLLPIFESTKQYVVPLFQRPYSWTKKEWEVLWNDLVDLYEMENPRKHFIGSIVTMQTHSSPEGIAKYLLIDGQQRLTTIFILLALLRDMAKQNRQERLSDEINNTLLVNSYKDGLDYFKLQPTQDDRGPFHSIIRSESPFSKQDKISEAYLFFASKLRRQSIDIQKLKKVICEHLLAVSIVLDQEDDPHLVFESLNAKGRELTQADLIRNYFFMKIYIDKQESIHARYWLPMQKKLGENLTEYVRHYLMRNGSVVKQNEVYFAIKDLINENDALECLKDLTCFAEYYHKLLKPEEEANKEIQYALLRLNRLDVTTAYPFLLNCYAFYTQSEISKADFVEILRVIENFIVRRFVCNRPTNPLNKFFASLCTQVKDTGMNIDKVKLILQAKDYPKDAEFKDRLINTKLYGSGDRATKTKLILEALEASYGHKENVLFDSLSVEHVMPQTLTEDWQSYLGEDWETIYGLLLHTIGNLTLTGYNSKLSNAPWEAKKQQLADSHLELNKYFQGKYSWRQEDIEQRSAFLANKAILIWPYFGDERTEQNGHKKMAGTKPTKVSILGQVFKVDSWRDVLEHTINTIAELEPEKFELLIKQYPRFVGRNEKRFRALRKLENGAFIEVNLSASDIQRFCLDALKTIDLTTDDWQVE